MLFCFRKAGEKLLRNAGVSHYCNISALCLVGLSRYDIGTMRQVLFSLLILCLLAACATPAVQPDYPTVREPGLTDDAFVADDAHVLPLRRWMPQHEAPEAVIIAVHGFNDYSRAFDGPGTRLAGKNLAVYAYDQRGFGNTQAQGIWAGHHNLTDDLAQMARLVKARHPEAPLYLLGESMGGAVVISTLAAHDLPEVTGAILSAPAVWGSHTMNRFYRSSLWLLAHTTPAEKFTGKGLKILASDNIPMLQEMGRDPLVIKETRIDAIYGIVHLMDRAFEDIAKVQKPMLVLYGANDQVIPPHPVLEAVRRTAAPHDFAFYPEGYHMLLRDLGAETVLNDIAGWVKEGHGPLPSGYEHAGQSLLRTGRVIWPRDIAAGIGDENPL